MDADYVVRDADVVEAAADGIRKGWTDYTERNKWTGKGDPKRTELAGWALIAALDAVIGKEQGDVK